MPMTQQQAAQHVERVMELFPGAGAEQGVVLVKNFQRFDPDVVIVAITRHAETHQFLNVPDLISAAIEETRRRPDPAKAAQRREDAKAAAYWQAVYALRDDLTDDDLTDLAREILPRLPEFARARAERVGLRQSKLFLSYVFEKLRPGQGVPA